MSYTKQSLFACAPATVRGHPVQLGADPKGNNILYANGRTVIIRNIANPAIATEYTQHSAQVTVARYSPSGYYIASGDVAGKVRVWDTTQAENILKNETKVISGRINDLCWDSESQRIIAVGDGKEQFGRAFMFDSGTSVGEISGHIKVINAVSIRQSRPFRAATCSDDMTVNFYHGVPYKFVLSHSDHTRFVQCARFSPSGDHFASAGMDAKLFLYNGKTGEKVCDLSAAVGAESAHKGGIYSIAWSPTSSEILSSSADGTCKIWDISAQKVVNTFTLADNGTVEDQQVGNLWQGEHLLSLSLSGDLNYLDRQSPRPRLIVRGHQKGITAMTSRPLHGLETFFTGSYDGRVYAWENDTGNGIPIAGSGHTNQITGLATLAGKDLLVSVAMDDTLRMAGISTKSFSELTVKLDSVPSGLAVSPDGGFYVVATLTEILLIRSNGQISYRMQSGYTPLSVAISPDGKTVAIGGQDNKVHLHAISENSLDETDTLDNARGAVHALSFSPDRSLLAAGDSDRKVLCYDVASRTLKTSYWCYHTAKVTCLAWSADGRHVASGSLDTSVYIWSVEKPMKNIAIRGAHQGEVTGVAWRDETTVISTGADACVKAWNIKFHQ